MTPKLQAYFDQWNVAIQATLKKVLPPRKDAFMRLQESMRYSVFAGGKRLRPVLVIAAAEACGKPGRSVLLSGCAMELIHTYSLIHDDLPAMDDDDLRRGRPTNHKVFGEAMAILAGDGLLTFAFDLIAKNAKMLNLSAPAVVAAIETVSWGAGHAGMVGGQAVDLEMDDGAWLQKSKPQQARVLQTIHESKTAALIQASLQLGAIISGAKKDKIQALSRYGKAIGLAFQIADDVLDIIGDKKLLGKQGSDAANQKLTYPALFGVEKSQAKAQQLVSQAKRHLAPLGKRAEPLVELADYIVQRTY